MYETNGGCLKMEVFMTLALAIVVQLVNYTVTTRMLDETSRIISSEVRDAILDDEKRKSDDDSDDE